MGTLLIILVFPLFFYVGMCISGVIVGQPHPLSPSELVKRLKKDAVKADLPQEYDAHMFPTLSPKSDRRDDVVAHKRDVQRYLMDTWEQRMEEEVGATAYRAIYFQAKELAEQSESACLSRLAMLGTSSFDNVTPSMHRHYATLAEKQYPMTAAKIKKDVEGAIAAFSRKRDWAKEEYNRRMNRPLDAELPNYRYSGLTTYLPSATLNEVKAIEAPKEKEEEPQIVYDVNRERQRLVAEVVEAEPVEEPSRDSAHHAHDLYRTLYESKRLQRELEERRYGRR